MLCFQSARSPIQIIIINPLSSYTTTWREEVDKNRNEILPLNCFVDDSRYVIEDFDDEYETPQEYVDRLTKDLENAAYDYPDTIWRWHNQPHYVEAWVEKKANVGKWAHVAIEGL